MKTSTTRTQGLMPLGDNELEQNQLGDAKGNSKLRKAMGLYSKNVMKGSVHTFFERPAGSNKNKANNRQKPRKR
jgi:hypothetical protein